MPKDEWAKNTIPALFREWGAWPWVGDGPGWMWRPESILDVACGLSLKSKFIDTATRVGLDLHRPYLEAASEQNPDVCWVPMVGDATKLRTLFLPKTFDLVLLLDIVEHVDKALALDMIAQAEEIARVAVVIETPRGLIPQNLDILGFGQHHLQTHRCGFEKEELEELGYQVFVRDYTMAPIKRHTDLEVDTECQLLNAIKRVDQ
jgi:hypothetical protein